MKAPLKNSNVDGDQQGKYNYKNQASELKQVKEYLTVNNATATMVATALNIYRPNLTRYKNMLEVEGVLIVTHRGSCKETNYQADYLTCDPKLVREVKEYKNADSGQTSAANSQSNLFHLNK